jgi:SHS2 domain-containing protein
MRRGFRFIEHTADIGVVAYGADIGQVFVSAARALFSLITEPEAVTENLSRDIELEAPDEESLLIEWLNELIYLFDTEHVLFKRFAVNVVDGKKLKARAWGEKVDPSRHQLKTGVKAATYHQLSLAGDSGRGYRAQVIFDI